MSAWLPQPTEPGAWLLFGAFTEIAKRHMVYSDGRDLFILWEGSMVKTANVSGDWAPCPASAKTQSVKGGRDG